MKWIMGLVLSMCLLGGCKDHCTTLDTRCNGSVVEECLDNKNWEMIMNCQELQPGPWVCCETADQDSNGEIAGCIPSGEACK